MGRANKHRRRRRAERSRDEATSSWTSMRRGSIPAYFSLTAISGARVPAQVTPGDGSREELEIGVPDPRNVAAVRDPVVQSNPDVDARSVAGPVLLVLEAQGAEDLVGSGGILDQQDGDLLPGHFHRLDASEGRLGALEARHGRRGLHAQSAGRPRGLPGRYRRCRGRGGAGEARGARWGSQPRPGSRACRPGGSPSRRRRARDGRRRSWGMRSGRGGRRTRARTSTGRRSGGSAWRRGRAAARAAPGRDPRSRSR